MYCMRQPLAVFHLLLLIFALVTHEIMNSAVPADIDFFADQNRNFDFLIFSQQWPLTRCISLAENIKGPKCVASPFHDQYWTIHGIWPTRVGTQSPAFCNKLKPFDVHEIEPFIIELNEYWFSVENDTRSSVFWQHEWSKHGTCCAEQIEDLETEQKFFMQGLKWLRQFNMSEILETVEIIPGGNYKVVDIHNIVYEKLNKIPSIHCVRTNDGNNYISEIRLCFSKSLELIDCQVTGNAEVVYRSKATYKELVTNCNLHKDIIYPATLPDTYVGPKSTNSWLQINLHKAIDFLKQSLL